MLFFRIHLQEFYFHDDCKTPGLFAAFEQKPSGGRGFLDCPGEAQRLSSLTFGCFQVRGKNPQVLSGPSPSQRSLGVQGETEDREEAGKNQVFSERF